MIQTLENRVKLAMRGIRPGATLTAEDVDALYGFIEAEIVDAMKEAKKEGINAEREACRQAVRSVADELHPERDHVKWGPWTSAIEEAEKRIRARS